MYHTSLFLLTFLTLVYGILNAAMSLIALHMYTRRILYAFRITPLVFDHGTDTTEVRLFSNLGQARLQEMTSPAPS
jgi:hypothetical protein